LPDSSQASIFFLVFLRALAFLVSGPLFSFKGIPAVFKIGFSFALAVVTFPLVALNTQVNIPGDAWGYGLAVVSETAFGLLLGTAVTIILNSIRMAGQFIDLQIGYSMANLIDPINNVQNTLLSQYLYLLALVFWFLIDGHYSLIMGLVRSYQIVPISAASFDGSVAFTLTKIFSTAFTIALKVSAPVLAVLLIADLALGFLSRTTPQINVFLTGFPIKIAAGLLTLSFLIPLLGTMMRFLFNTIERDLYTLMKVQL
jgi:flagellar biosynthetic protein FliR